MQNAMALYHSDQVHRKEPKSYSMLLAMVTEVLEDKQQYFLVFLKGKGGAMPVAPVKMVGDGKRGYCKQWSSKGSLLKRRRMCVEAR